MSLSSLLAAGSSSSGGSALSAILPIVLIGAVFYFLLIRPQRRRQKDAVGLLRQLSEGDEVITNGGIYGFINAIDGDTIWLDIADNVEIRVHRSSISRKVDPIKEPAGGSPVVETDDTDDKDGKNNGNTATPREKRGRNQIFGQSPNAADNGGPRKFTRFQKPAPASSPSDGPDSMSGADDATQDDSEN